MTEAPREAVIEVRGLVTRFGTHVVHEGLDLDVYRGEVLGVVGGSGTGKSVLLREIVGLNLLRFRRAIGQLAFVYALLHFIVWLWLDRQFDWPRIVEDLLKRPYIIVGFAALLLLLPLALTSTDSAIRRLGGVRWRRLHRLAYPATLLAGLHFIWLVKAWPAEPLLYGAGIVLLLAWRAVRSRRKGARRAMPQKFRANEKKLS